MSITGLTCVLAYGEGSIGDSFIIVILLSGMKAGADIGDLGLEVMQCLQKFKNINQTNKKPPLGFAFDKGQWI